MSTGMKKLLISLLFLFFLLHILPRLWKNQHPEKELLETSVSTATPAPPHKPLPPLAAMPPHIDPTRHRASSLPAEAMSNLPALGTDGEARGTALALVASPPPPTSPSTALQLQTPEQQVGGRIGLLAGARAWLPPVSVVIEVPLPLGPFNLLVPLEELIDMPVRVLVSVLLAAAAGALWQTIWGLLIRRLRAQPGCLPLWMISLYSGGGGGTHHRAGGLWEEVRVLLGQVGEKVLDALVSGTLVGMLVFWACMPNARASVPIALLAEFLTPLAMVMEVASRSIATYLIRLWHQKTRRYHPHEP